MKRLWLSIVVAVAFLAGYAGTANAWPGVPDRSEHHGYFRNIQDFYGDDVIAGGYPAGTATNANNFISYTLAKLNSGSGQDRIGAAFIIQTMIGLNRAAPPTVAQINEWASRVRAAEAEGRVSWNIPYTFTINSFYQGTGSGSNPNDDAFFYDSGTSASIVFRNRTGGIAYAIRRVCANPVGNLAALPVAGYTMTGRTTVAPTVKPGEAVTFQHYLRNAGPGPAPSIWWTTFNRPSNVILAQGPSGGYASGQEIRVNVEVFTVPITATVGTQYCRQVGYDPSNSTGGRNGRAPIVCTTVVHSYELAPQVSVNPSSGGEGDTLTFTYSVHNNGPTESQLVACKVAANTFPPGHAPLPQQDVDRNPDPGYVQPAMGCPRIFPRAVTTALASETVTIGGLPAGSRVCRSLVLNPKSEDGGPRSSAEACTIVNKKPHAHFLGGDVWAGGGVLQQPSNTCALNNANVQGISRTLPGGATYAGTWSEYGLFALGSVTSFGSAAHPLTTTNGRSHTFSNSNPANLGRFAATAHCLTDYTATYSNLPTSPAGAINLFTAASNFKRRINGNVTLNATGALQAGKRQVLYVVGNVTITSDLMFNNGPYNSLAAIPTLTIVATGNITVNANVQRLDGIYVSLGNFNTCDAVGPLTTNLCNQPLRITGSVEANRVLMRRTSGGAGNSDALRQTPAEIINLVPYIFLGGVSDSAQTTKVRTTTARDLPPRY